MDKMPEDSKLISMVNGVGAIMEQIQIVRA